MDIIKPWPARFPRVETTGRPVLEVGTSSDSTKYRPQGDALKSVREQIDVCRAGFLARKPAPHPSF
jgi:hypothetical protein